MSSCPGIWKRLTFRKAASTPPAEDPSSKSSRSGLSRISSFRRVAFRARRLYYLLFSSQKSMSLQFRDKDSKNNRCYNIISEKNLSDWNTDRIRPLSIIIISGIPKKLTDSANYPNRTADQVLPRTVFHHSTYFVSRRRL